MTEGQAIWPPVPKLDFMDLFETPELIPESVLYVLTRYALEDMDYPCLEDMLAELKPLGYTFDYYLDGTPFDLRPIN